MFLLIAILTGVSSYLIVFLLCISLGSLPDPVDLDRGPMAEALAWAAWLGETSQGTSPSKTKEETCNI